MKYKRKATKIVIYIQAQTGVKTQLGGVSGGCIKFSNQDELNIL